MSDVPPDCFGLGCPCGSDYDCVPGTYCTDGYCQDYGVDTSEDVIVQEEYWYVRIDDLSERGGAYDAFVVYGDSDEPLYFAEQVEAYVIGMSPIDAMEPIAALGAPDAYLYYPELWACLMEPDNGLHRHVELGGRGGVIVVRLQAPLQFWQRLEVLQVGDCEAENEVPRSRPYQVSVSNSPYMDGEWLVLGDGQGPSSFYLAP